MNNQDAPKTVEHPKFMFHPGNRVLDVNETPFHRKGTGEVTAADIDKAYVIWPNGMSGWYANTSLKRLEQTKYPLKEEI